MKIEMLEMERRVEGGNEECAGTTTVTHSL